MPSYPLEEEHSIITESPAKMNESTVRAMNNVKKIVFVYRVIQRECGLKTVRNRECQGSRRGDLGWTVGFTRIVSMVTVRQ